MPQDRSHPKQIEETVWTLTQIKRWWTQLQGKLTLWMILTLPNLIFPRLLDIMWRQVVFRETIYLSHSFFSCRKILFCVRFISNIGSLHYDFDVMGKKGSSFWRIFILNEVDSSLEWQKTFMKNCSKVCVCGPFGPVLSPIFSLLFTFTNGPDIYYVAPVEKWW